VSLVLELDVKSATGRFTLELSWSTEETALGIFGPSGAGKTTILEAIAGLRRDVRGRIAVRGVTWLDSARGFCLPPERRGVGYVPQEARLFPHRNVMGNIRAGRRRAGRAGARSLPPDRVVEVLELQGLTGADVGSLSGGERQRVALARALCSAPELLLLDEPLAGLDLPLRRRILPHLVRVQREFGIPTLHVAHEATEIKALCREVLVIASGREVARGRPQILFTDPTVMPMAWKDGFENVLRGKVSGTRDGLATVELEQGVALVVPGGELRPGDDVLLAVRAGDLIIAAERPAGLSAQNVLAGTVREIRAAGPDFGPDRPVLVFVALGSGGTPLVAAVTAESCRRLQLAAGRAVHLIAKAQSCHLLAAL